MSNTLSKESSHWNCHACGTIYTDPDDVDADDRRRHNTNVHEIACPVCQQSLTWVPMTWKHDYTRKVEVTFDYAFQVYRTDDGKAVDAEDGWDFSCSRCGGPSTLTDTNAYFEYYRCLNCGSTQKVH